MARRSLESRLRITHGALIVAALEVGCSLVWMLCDEDTRFEILKWTAATPSLVFRAGHVWALVTSALLQPDLLALLLNVFILWAFVPTLERFWGTKRFYKFVAITSVVGTLGGCLMGLATGHEVPIWGLSPFVWASIVAFGVVYARQPVQFFGVLPLTGRQMMYGFLGFLVLLIALGQKWEEGAAYAAAMLAAAVMTSKRWSPGLAWRKWRIARARRKLSVIEGGKPRDPKRPDERFIN